jgi:tRNA(fMet)-specific endonuclease VapC
MIYLLDTDTLIYMARGLKIAAPRNDLQRERFRLAGKIAAHCQRQQSLGHEVGLSAITVAELEYGARHSGDYDKEITAVRKILTPFVHFDFDAAACTESYGVARYFLEKAGTSIGAMDLLIAAHALALQATLVTNDTRHFPRVPKLKCVNWTN